jgi:imidazole glycerol-phosphate synthase subunit HisH
MSTVAIVDYGMCNLDSIRRAVEECGGSPVVTDDRSDIKHAARIVLPGVGSFADAMKNIRQRELDQVLVEQVREHGVPLLGICLGMQLLARRGEEGGDTDGLGLIDGEVVRLVPTERDHRIPHVGWNEVSPERDHPLFRGVAPRKDFYFVHSYHLRCSDDAQRLASTPYCGQFASAVARDAVMGVQFHPEKSQKAGFQLLRNFLAY